MSARDEAGSPARLDAERRASRLRRLALVALAAFALVYALAVRTEIGQRADNAAIKGSVRAVDAVPDRVVRRARVLLRVVSAGSLALATAILGAIAFLRRRPRLIIVPAIVVGVSIVGTELFKLYLFDRPDLITDGVIPKNTYPSGHTTVAISLGLSAILVSSARWRLPVAIAAALLAAAMGVMTMAGAWHRPSDPLGSFALTLAVAAATAAVFIRRAPEIAAIDEAPAAVSELGVRGIELGAFAAAALALAASVAAATARFGDEIDWTAADAAFLGSCAVVVAAAGLTVGALVRALNPAPSSAPGPGVR